jgi:hypothetical protein
MLAAILIAVILFIFYFLRVWSQGKDEAGPCTR